MQLESSASLSMTQAVQPGRVEEWDPAAGQSCIVGIASAKSRKNSWWTADVYMGGSIVGVPNSWMVDFRENPIKMDDDWGTQSC